MTSHKVLKDPLAMTFSQPLEFGDWPQDKIEKVIADIKSKYDLTGWELAGVNRGGYKKCQGYGEHKACDDLVTTWGVITWKRVK